MFIVLLRKFSWIMEGKWLLLMLLKIGFNFVICVDDIVLLFVIRFVCIENFSMLYILCER